MLVPFDIMEILESLKNSLVGSPKKKAIGLETSIGS